VVANYYIVETATAIEILTMGNRRFPADLTGRHPDADIAVARIRPDHLTAVSLGDSNHLEGGTRLQTGEEDLAGL
jgi:S1-C subfamily serine protease